MSAQHGLFFIPYYSAPAADVPASFPRGGQWAATKIQRAWKIYLWRISFYRFGRETLKWVGSLDWLQRHNRLYGTELAEREDVEG